MITTMLGRGLRRGTRALAALGALAALLPACGDGPICQTEALVFIVEPSGLVSGDSNATIAGVQTDVEVRSTFGRDATLTLTVEDEDGRVLETATATTDEQGNATFADVTIPPGGAELRVRGDAGECGRDEDVRHVEIGGGGDCQLEFAIAPEPSSYYAPLDVFNRSSDASAALPGHQGDVIIRTAAGHQVKLYLSGPGVVETEIGAGTADEDGELRLAVSLPEGQDNLRVECAGPGAGPRSSGVVSVYVDTVAPSCAITAPLPGTSLTPSLDADQDLGNGLQLTLVASAGGGDTEGEGAQFVITAPGGGQTTLTGTAVSGAGVSSAAATFDPATTPADFGVAFSTIDHAGNPCAVAETYRVVYGGCPIVVTAPTGPVTADADADGSNGAQVDVVLDVDPACVGRTVTSDCGSNDPGGTVGAGGGLTLRADVCDAVPCETSEVCTVRVTSSDGIETTAGASLVFDNQPPSVAVQVAAPSGTPCGGTVTPEQDQSLATPGTQIRMRVVSPGAASRELQLTNTSGTATFDASAVGGEVLVTVESGANDFVGLARDALGNTASTPVCRISLADLIVTFTGAAADGTVGAADGAVAGTDLTFTLTGTVSTAGASVSISVDGGAALPAVVSGTSWSRVLTLAERAAPYDVVASASAGPLMGQASLALTVDLTGPDPVSDLTAVADTRHSVRLAFTAPSDGAGGAVAGYRVRYATVALTDGNFDATGLPAPAPAPAAPGTAERLRVTPLRTGTAFWVGVAAVDASGNRAPAAIVGPLTPRFDQTAAYAAPSTDGNAQLGYAVARGRFNDDEFEDLAVAAPFADVGGVTGAGQVHVYFGSATGLATAPGLTINGATAAGGFGSSLAAVRWSTTSRHDLAIGEPFADAGSGAIHVFDGGAALPSGTVAATAAPRRIQVAAAANWFTGSALGWQLARADHDGDGVDDLVTTAIFGSGGAAGAAVVFYGGTVPSGIVRVSDSSSGGSGTTVMRMYEQGGGALFGFYLHNLGRTQGAADLADDLGVAFAEDGVAGADVLVLRATSGRPATSGVNRMPFTIGRDVRIRYVTIDTVLEWGSAMGSIADQNGDGARDIVIGDYRDGNNAGVVFVIDGNTLGTAGVAATTDAGVVLTTLRDPTGGRHFGMAVVNNATVADADVDGDGIEDLIVAGRAPGVAQAQLQVWFGPLPVGLQSPPAPDHRIDGPASFTAAVPNTGGSPITAIWAGDVNGDGLDDVCWADWNSASRDGGFQVLFDDGQ